MRVYFTFGAWFGFALDCLQSEIHRLVLKLSSLTVALSMILPKSVRVCGTGQHHFPLSGPGGALPANARVSTGRALLTLKVSGLPVRMTAIGFVEMRHIGQGMGMISDGIFVELYAETGPGGQGERSTVAC